MKHKLIGLLIRRPAGKRLRTGWMQMALSLVLAGGVYAALPAPHVNAAWSVSIATSGTNAAANQAVTITATTNLDVGPTAWGLQIYDAATGAAVKNCSSGTSCSVQVSGTGVTRTYKARIGMFDGTETQVTSNQVPVSWANQSLNVSLGASKSNAAANEAVTLTATTNVDVGPLRWGTQIVDVATGAAVKNCSSGTSCSVQVSGTGVTRTYKARIGMFDGTETQVTSNQVPVSWAQTAPTGPGVRLDVPFQSQWNVAAQNGGANCGPASITMALSFYRKPVTFGQAVTAIRMQYPSGDTDFKASSYVSLLQASQLDYARSSNQIQNVGSTPEIRAQLDQGHPVLMEVINSYGTPAGLYGTVQNMAPVAHIVVVTGYQLSMSGAVQTVFINDPLAIAWSSAEGRWVADGNEGRGKNFPLSVHDFESAAQGGGWYGVAVVPR